MKKLVILLFAMCFVASCGGPETTDAPSLYAGVDKSSTPNTLTDEEKKEGWQLLFDGKTTDGWHGFNMKGFPDSWALEDGCLTMNSTDSAENQDILTAKKYRDFALSLEYKLTPGANSGVLFQISEDPKYKFAYETGPEFQVIDHEGWTDKLEDWQINGSNYAMYPPKTKPYKPVGDWNHLFLMVKGNKVTQILNGEVVVEYEKNSEEWSKLRNSGKWNNFPDWGKFDEGFISLQNHGTKVWYRDVKLKEL
jgi:hypothetical protein